MPTKRLERLMFVQGGNCFFCKSSLVKADASIEHLFATANGGGNNEENCVVCCKSLNAILGSMSLKEKVQVVLNQKGNFKCPRGVGAAQDAADAAIVKAKLPPIVSSNESASKSARPDNLALVVANLKLRGNARPRTIRTLTTSIATIFPNGIAGDEIAAIIQKLQSTGTVTLNEGKLSYVL
ncbi:HNH endonuclease [Massilia sp. CCM 8693]|uniref:HNH endonuclease n=2 Tax=Massilia aquatica TaxID=2609000 RepID=A0ABX0M6D3_9BURK|nr:HNH endonuclease [Massilia aquatica]